MHTHTHTQTTSTHIPLSYSVKSHYLSCEEGQKHQRSKPLVDVLGGNFIMSLSCLAALICQWWSFCCHKYVSHSGRKKDGLRPKGTACIPSISHTVLLKLNYFNFLSIMLKSNELHLIWIVFYLHLTLARWSLHYIHISIAIQVIKLLLPLSDFVYLTSETVNNFGQ